MAAASFAGAVEFNAQGERFAGHDRKFRLFQDGAIAGCPDVGNHIRAFTGIGYHKRIEQDGTFFDVSETKGVTAPNDRGAGEVSGIFLQDTGILGCPFAVGLVELFEGELYFLIKVCTQKADVFEQAQFLFCAETFE